MQPIFSTRFIVRHQEIIDTVYAPTDYQYNLQVPIVFPMHGLSVTRTTWLPERARCLGITSGGGRVGSKVP